MTLLERITARVAELEEQKAKFWAGAEAFTDKRDAHGTIDMAAEAQLVDRAIEELRKLL